MKLKYIHNKHDAGFLTFNYQFCKTLNMKAKVTESYLFVYLPVSIHAGMHWY